MPRWPPGLAKQGQGREHDDACAIVPRGRDQADAVRLEPAERGYDYDTLSADLSVLLSELHLHDVTLVGFSTGIGEVTRYLAAYGSGRVRGAVLLAPLPPFLLRTGDNPEGIDRSVFDEFIADISADRPAATKTFLDKFYNIDLLGGSHVSDQAWQNSFHVAIRASAKAALGCVAASLEDFRGDLSRIDVPVLVEQGSQDRVLPLRRPETGYLL